MCQLGACDAPATTRTRHGPAEAGYTAVEARAVGSLQKAAFDGEGEMLEFQIFMATATAG